MLRALSLITGLLLSGSALADRPEAGIMVGGTHFSANGYGAGGWAIAARGGYRMQGGLTPEGVISTHMTDAYNQVVIGGGARYYFAPARETWQPFAMGHLAYATKAPSALGVTAGGGVIYRIVSPSRLRSSPRRRSRRTPRSASSPATTSCPHRAAGTARVA